MATRWAAGIIASEREPSYASSDVCQQLDTPGSSRCWLDRLPVCTEPALWREASVGWSARNAAELDPELAQILRTLCSESRVLAREPGKAACLDHLGLPAVRDQGRGHEDGQSNASAGVSRTRGRPSSNAMSSARGSPRNTWRRTKSTPDVLASDSSTSRHLDTRNAQAGAPGVRWRQSLPRPRLTP